MRSKGGTLRLAACTDNDTHFFFVGDEVETEARHAIVHACRQGVSLRTILTGISHDVAAFGYHVVVSSIERQLRVGGLRSPNLVPGLASVALRERSTVGINRHGCLGKENFERRAMVGAASPEGEDVVAVVDLVGRCSLLIHILRVDIGAEILGVGKEPVTHEGGAQFRRVFERHVSRAAFLARHGLGRSEHLSGASFLVIEAVALGGVAHKTPEFGIFVGEGG